MVNLNWASINMAGRVTRKEAQKIRSKKWREKNKERFNQNMKWIHKKIRNRDELMAKRKEKLEGLLEIKKKILWQN